MNCLFLKHFIIILKADSLLLYIPFLCSFSSHYHFLIGVHKVENSILSYLPLFLILLFLINLANISEEPYSSIVRILDLWGFFLIFYLFRMISFLTQSNLSLIYCFVSNIILIFWITEKPYIPLLFTCQRL